MDWVRADGYQVSDDRRRIDIDQVWKWLSQDAYWAIGRARDVVARSIEHSMVFGLYAPDGRQAGVCRMVTDYATFAWLCDVYVDPSHRGNGAGTWMVELAVTHEALSGLKRQVLATADAHGLYEKMGYRRFGDVEAARWMLRDGDGR